MITIYDTETTGFLKAKGNPLSVQPHIIEIYAMQVDEDFNLINEVNTLVKPPIEISKKITGITGITNDDVRNAPTFSEIYSDLLTVFWKSHTVVAHNLPFDEGMLINELKRIGKVYHFPFPPHKFCTIEQSMHLKGKRLNNADLYEIATGNKLENAHRAKNDVMALFESYKWLVSQEKNNEND